jgi:hypothetical protein
MALEIKTAAQLIALDLEGRQVARRAARETELMRAVFRAFVERAGPIRVEEIAAAVPGRPPDTVFEDLEKLNDDDLLRIRTGRVDLAYPFSGSPTPFVVDLGQGRGERYVCCAIDALGLATMLDRPVQIRSQCHHCAMPLALTVQPSGPEPEAASVMVWAGRRVEDERRACDSL